LPINKTGKIILVRGGRKFLKKCDTFGIRIGKKVKKISSQWIKGPICLKIDNINFAIGFKMASKIDVEIID